MGVEIPKLFTLYMLPLRKIISRYRISFHCYADDTQFYMRADTHSTPSSATSPLTACLKETRAWMRHSSLKLNSSKTEAILNGSPHQIQISTITYITFAGRDIPLTSTVIASVSGLIPLRVPYQSPLHNIILSPPEYCQTSSYTHPKRC